MNKYLNPFRLTTYLLILHFLGHTSGALLSTPHFGAESDVVVATMKSVHFRAQTSTCTWFGFYLGFGWLVSIFFLFSAVLTWFLGGLSTAEQRSWSVITWALFLSYALSAIIAWRYFFAAPFFFSTA